jgi:uncharacterized damage-inducible protein DinB
MPVAADTLRTHLDYTAWATRKLLDSASRLSADQLNHDFGTADRSVLGTLVHTFAADRIWLYRVTGGENPGFVSDADRSLPVLVEKWPALHGRWIEWAAMLTDEGVRANISYTDLKGKPWTQPVWQILLHLANHGTHHRGQVSGFLRSLGQTPPGTDLIYYYRELG